MKMKVLVFTVYVFAGLYLTADEAKPPHVIRRGNEVLTVSNRPSFTISEPVTNSFLYIDGEYIEPPYTISASNLAVCINGRVIDDYAPLVSKRESYSGRVGITPESVGKAVDRSCEFYVRKLTRGCVLKFFSKGGHSSSGLSDDGGGLAYVELAKRAARGDPRARDDLVNAFKLGESVPDFRPDWIQRLAGNTNLEARATRILEAKRQREQHERGRRERMERQDGRGKPRQDGNAHQ
jgi:hypothetical protein